MSSFVRNTSSKVLCLLFCLFVLAPSPVLADTPAAEAPNAVQQQLDKGEVVVGMENIGKTKFVTGRVLIDQPPDKVWPIMVNPFEFQQKISPRMRTVDVVLDKLHKSILKVTMDTFPIPDVTYLVESDYTRTDGGARIDFHRIGGTLKDFKGHWLMNPAHNGQKTELVYSMYLDPGFYVPQWIVRMGVKQELPRTLVALRKRVEEVVAHNATLEKKTILAATPLHKHEAAY
jgi:hypothetical protein